VKLYLLFEHDVHNLAAEKIPPIVKSKFKQLKIIGEKAEVYFLNNYQNIAAFADAEIEDGRNYGDGYDLQLQKVNAYLLAEVKGIRTKKGAFRMTENEYFKAKEYKKDYGLVVVSNLEYLPKMTVIFDPIHELELTEKIITSQKTNFHSRILEW
jgi:hypothetical protein